MLVLTRKLNEQILIGDAVLKVVAIRGNTVRLGIEADSSIQVRRAELCNGSKTSPDGQDTGSAGTV